MNYKDSLEAQKLHQELDHHDIDPKETDKRRILNAGCGLDLSVGSDFVDIDPRDKRVIQCDLDKDPLPYADRTFYMVYCHSVWEHLTNHQHFLKECGRVLEDGSKLVIYTDNPTSISYIFLHEHGDLTETWKLDDRHFGLYSAAHIRNHAKKAGLEFVDYEYLMGEPHNPILRVLKAVLFFLAPKYTATTIKAILRKGRD